MANETINRRQALQWITSGGILAFIAALVYPVIRYLIPPDSGEANTTQIKLPFGRAEIEADPQKAKTFKFGKMLGIIVLIPDGTLKALSATCTHLDCTVQHRPDWGILWCACHNGKYDLNGKNISGPPPRPLETFIVDERENEIFIMRRTSS